MRRYFPPTWQYLFSCDIFKEFIFSVCPISAGNLALYLEVVTISQASSLCPGPWCGARREEIGETDPLG